MAENKRQFRFIEYNREEKYPVLFLSQLQDDPNMAVLFDPMMFNGTQDDLRIFTTMPGKFFAIYDTETGTPFGVCGFVRYERLRLGWKMFLSLQKGKDEFYDKILKSFISYYFNNFTDKYLYAEYLESHDHKESLKVFNARSAGESIVFARGKENITHNYIIARVNE